MRQCYLPQRFASKGSNDVDSDCFLCLVNRKIIEGGWGRSRRLMSERRKPPIAVRGQRCGAQVCFFREARPEFTDDQDHSYSLPPPEIVVCQPPECDSE